jgi:hypothetical protein
MSVVVSGPPSNPTYKLKPVLHLFEDPLQAATIEGSIDALSFGDSGKTTIVVIAESDGEEFTRLEVTKESDTDPTAFSIYWIVPNKSYTVQIDLYQDGIIDCEKTFGDEGDFDPPGPGDVVDIGTCTLPI